MYRRWITATALLAGAFHGVPSQALGERQHGLPEYSAADVANRRTEETGIWVSYGNGVYDVTEFIEAHPGGAEKIMRAAGGPVEPHWAWFQQHLDSELVDELLEEMRVGNLAEADVLDPAVGRNPYEREPYRSPALDVRSENPLNAEIPFDRPLTYITPNELFYVRNHLPVPPAPPLELEVVDRHGKVHVFTLEELKRDFEPVQVTAVMQCGGNRRDELNSVRAVRGGKWGAGAISNATWKGVRLSDILQRVEGVEDGEAALRERLPPHIEFEGGDCDMERCYAVSIPGHRLRDPDCDVIVAYEMNGVELPPDHGYPLRAVVPGVVGARNVKWLRRVIYREEECGGHWQAKDYRVFSPSIDYSSPVIDYSSVPSIQDMPVTSAVTHASMVHDGVVRLEGYAYSGGGHRIIRVDVTLDGGQTWRVAEVLPHPPSSPSGHKDWACSLWRHDVVLSEVAPEGSEDMKVHVKAVDDSYNTQPQTVESVWNLRGLLNNAWFETAIPHPSTVGERSSSYRLFQRYGRVDGAPR